MRMLHLYGYDFRRAALKVKSLDAKLQSPKPLRCGCLKLWKLYEKLLYHQLRAEYHISFTVFHKEMIQGLEPKTLHLWKRPLSEGQFQEIRKKIPQSEKQQAVHRYYINEIKAKIYREEARVAKFNIQARAWM